MNYTDINEVIGYTQNKRYELIEKISIKLKDKDIAPEDAELLLKALDSFDKSTFTKQKLVIEENTSQIQKHANKLLGEILAKFNLPVTEGHNTGKDYSINKELTDDELVPDETKVGPVDLDLDHL